MDGSTAGLHLRLLLAALEHPVNPRSEIIQGLPAFASVKDIPGPVDLAICTVPPGAVMSVLGECAEKGVGSLVVFTSGFAEVGESGAQEAMAGLAREAGIRLMGPNCMGMVNFGSRAVGSFHPAFAEDIVPGAIGLVSQSGAFGGLAYMLARSRGHSLIYMFTTGNEADVDIGDCTAFLADDPDTKAILLYMEGCRNGPKFLPRTAMRRGSARCGGLRGGLRRRAATGSRRTPSFTVMSSTGSQSITPVTSITPLMMSAGRPSAVQSWARTIAVR